MGSIADKNLQDLGTGYIIDDCKAACDQNSACKSIDFGTSGGRCLLGSCQIGDGTCVNDNDVDYQYSSCIEASIADFTVFSLSSSCSDLEMDTQAGDDGGMVRYSSTSDRVYYEGDSRVVAYDASGGWASPASWSTYSNYESVHAVPNSGHIYQLLDSSGSPLSTWGTFSQLRCLDGDLQTQSTASVDIAFNIWTHRVFIGSGRLAVQDSGNMWHLV